MSSYYTMPEGRTFCGRYLCCRQKNHEGNCEEDITLLSDKELQQIRDSVATQ